MRDGQVANRPVYAAIGVGVDGSKDVVPTQPPTAGMTPMSHTQEATRLTVDDGFGYAGLGLLGDPGPTCDLRDAGPAPVLGATSSVQELVDLLPVSRPPVSHHPRRLRPRGLVVKVPNTGPG